MNSVRERVYRIVSDVLDVPVQQITEDTSPDIISSWDSLSHLNLVLSLESEFDVRLSDDQITDMLSVRIVMMVLREHGIGE